VTIPGFGTFTFIHKRIDVGNNKYLLIQRPVFAFSEKFAQTHGLKFTHYPVNGSIPVHPLNYFFIQTQSTYTRDQIEQCVKHVLQVFNRSVAAQRNVEFTFSRIGKLQIRDGKVKMRFFKDFVQDVDGNGGNGGKFHFDNTCNVRKKEYLSPKNKLYLQLFRGHKQVIRLYPNETQQDLQQLRMLFFRGKSFLFLYNNLFD
jgi:nucleoid DNA-binding protein